MNIKKIICLVKDPVWTMSVLVVRPPSFIKEDEKYLKWDFYHGLGKWSNLTTPKFQNVSQ